ncbi:MAG: phytoene/squalene synthase family protein [Deltaproteobacteria bacterium]|nr:phytoene/squalene synthase family protein [Deltaproteobacteria bacterium]
MLRLPDPYDEDVRRCREILRAGSKSFHAASLFLPARVRGPASVLYAFCRVADDAVDLVSPKHAPEAVARMRERLGKIYAGEPNDTPVDRALSVVVKRYDLPRAIPEAMLDGFEWDVEGRRYADMESLQGYCARVAATVGVMMTVLMGRRDPGVLARACDLGVAMQLTNICRDVGEDARNGRVYLPADWLAEAGVDVEALLRAPSFSAPLGLVIERTLKEADRLYQRSADGVAMLPRDCRMAIRAAALLYSNIGEEVRRRGGDSVSSRAVVPGARKLRLLARAFGARFSADREPKEGDAPALPAVQFLVDAVQGVDAG